MSDPKPLTRQELAEFLPGLREIRAFEQLFKVIPSELINNNTDTGNSSYKSLESISMSIESLRIAKGTNVLSWLSM